jgi:hypothetical protein
MSVSLVLPRYQGFRARGQAHNAPQPVKSGGKLLQAALAISQTTGSEGCKCGLLDNQVLLLAETKIRGV